MAKETTPQEPSEAPKLKANAKQVPAAPRYVVRRWIGVSADDGSWKHQWQPSPKPITFPEEVIPAYIEHWLHDRSIVRYQEEK